MDCLKEHRMARRGGSLATTEEPNLTLKNPQSAAYVPFADSPFTERPRVLTMLTSLKPDTAHLKPNYIIDVPQKPDKPLAEKPTIKLGFWDNFKSVRE